MKRTPLKRSADVTRAWQERSRRSAARRSRDPDKPRSPINPFSTPCWLARFDPEHECEGVVVRCHLVKEQWLRDRLGLTVAERWDPAFWVPGCGGPTGIGGHHGRLDAGLLRLDRRDLPARLERRALADERIAVKLDLLYGERPVIGRSAA